MKKSDHQLRWVILFLNCVLLFGMYYTFDMPAALKSKIKDRMGSPDNFETMYSLLYSLPAFPNVILPFFGGFSVDTLGVRSCLLVFTTTLALGHALFCFGLSLKSWPLMFLGRFIFGCGETSTSVANSTILSDWFEGKELAFSFAFNVAIARLGSVVNNIASPAIASSTGVVMACWIGGIFIGCTLTSVVLLIPIDAKLDKLVAEESKIAERDDHHDDKKDLLLLKTTEVGEKNELDETLRLSDVFKLPYIFKILTVTVILVYGCIVPFNNVASTLFLERDYFKSPPSGCQLLHPNECQSDINIPVNCPASSNYQSPLPVNITYNDIYYDELSSSDIDCSENEWKNGCTREWCERYDSAILTANTIMSIPYFMAACLFPVCGYLVDVYGHRVHLIITSGVLLLVVHLLLGLTSIEPIALMIGQGLSYTFFASAMWPCVPLVVDKKYLGIAYGVSFSMQNVGLALFPLVIASIYDRSNNEYIPNVEFFFASMALLAVGTGLYLWYVDTRYCDSILNNFVVGSDVPHDEGDDRDCGEYSALMSDEKNNEQDVEEAEVEAIEKERERSRSSARRRRSRLSSERGQGQGHGSFSSAHSSATPEAVMGSLTWH